MLVRDILEESVQKFGKVNAVKWLNRKEISERSYYEMMKNAVSVRKGLLAEGFEGKHIALIGTSSVEWIESYIGIITGCTTAVPLDAALPWEDLVEQLQKRKELTSVKRTECPDGEVRFRQRPVIPHYRIWMQDVIRRSICFPER